MPHGREGSKSVTTVGREGGFWSDGLGIHVNHHSCTIYARDGVPTAIKGATLVSGRPCRREGPASDEALAARRVVVSRPHDVLLIERHSR